MAFKKVQELDCETSVALGGFNKTTGKPNPKQIEGYFLGTKQTVSKKSASGFASLHILQTENGNVGVWGKTDLDRKMKNVQAGVMTRITQSGTAPTPRGDMYKYTVEVDTDNAIEVGFSSPAAQEETSYEDAPNYTAAEEEETDLDAEETVYDAPAPVRATAPKTPVAAPNAASAARTAALLKSRTRTA